MPMKEYTVTRTDKYLCISDNSRISLFEDAEVIRKDKYYYQDYY